MAPGIGPSLRPLKCLLVPDSWSQTRKWYPFWISIVAIHVFVNGKYHICGELNAGRMSGSLCEDHLVKTGINVEAA